MDAFTSAQTNEQANGQSDYNSYELFLGKYVDFNKVYAEINTKGDILNDSQFLAKVTEEQQKNAKNGVNLTGQQAKEFVVKEMIRQSMLSISRAETVKKDIVNSTWSKKLKAATETEKEILLKNTTDEKQKISDRIYVVGYGARENVGFNDKNSKKFMKSRFSLLDKNQVL